MINHLPANLRAIWLAVSLILLLATPAFAADAASAETDLKRKQEEVERLKRELDKAQTDLNKTQSDLKKLEKENERLRKEKTVLPPPAKAPAAPAQPVKPIATLPPLGSDELVEVAEWVGHFRADPAAAAQRYDKKIIRLQGEIAGFDAQMLGRTYEVLLVSPDPALRVVCKFSYLEQDWRSVYTQDRGRKLVRTSQRGGEKVLLEVGQTVTFKGRCLGLKKDELVLSGFQEAR